MENSNSPLPEDKPIHVQEVITTDKRKSSLLAGGVKPRRVNDTVSPAWGATTKLIMGLALAGVSLFLVFRFINIVGPLVLAFILAYLFYPMADAMHKYARFPWRVAVTILYLVLMILLMGSLAAGGLAIIEQVQSLINFLSNAITDLPNTIQTLISTSIHLGPFTFRLNALDLNVNTVTQQVLGVVQPTLSGAGTVVGTLASRAAEVVGWAFFVFLISYFILSESDGLPNSLVNLNLPGYAQDFQCLSDELSRIWNAFLRGQLTIVLLVILVYTFLLGGLGVKFFIGLAILAGLSRFVPFVGAAITWATYGLVAFFQGSTLFGLPPLGYAALVVGCAWFIDMCIDNLISPRVMADALRVHPAAVMVFALVGANLLGFIGFVLAAPVLATVKLFVDYMVHKMLDQDPWADLQLTVAQAPLPPLVPEVRKRYQHVWRKVARVFSNRKV